MTTSVAQALLLVQGAFGLVATLGLLVLMGFHPAYAVVPLLHCALLFALASAVRRGRRWALIGALLVEGAALAGWLIQAALGLLPPIDFTVNLTGLLTTVALPVAVIVLCGQALARA